MRFLLPSWYARISATKVGIKFCLLKSSPVIYKILYPEKILFCSCSARIWSVLWRWQTQNNWMLRTTYLLQTRGDRTGRKGSRSLSMRRVLMTQTSSEYCEGYKVTESSMKGHKLTRHSSNWVYWALYSLHPSFIRVYCEIHLIHSHKYFPRSVIYYICINMNNFRWLF